MKTLENELNHPLKGKHVVFNYHEYDAEGELIKIFNPTWNQN